jgi:hypothetical protein
MIFVYVATLAVIIFWVFTLDSLNVCMLHKINRVKSMDKKLLASIGVVMFIASIFIIVTAMHGC